MAEGWKDAQTKSGLIFTPLVICCTSYLNLAIRKKLLSFFCLSLAAAALYCLCIAFLNYQQSHNPQVFYYHALVSPFKHHAIYFSILVFIALVFLIENLRNAEMIFNKIFHIFLIVFLSGFLFLLSSKLVIGFYIAYLFYCFVAFFKSRALIIGSFLLFMVIGTLALTIPNPVSERFYDIIKGDIRLINKKEIGPDKYLNGVQFRLLQWKLVPEILNENHAWLTGVGLGHAQHFVDQKYISKKMYVGDPARGDRGFLGYNAHNQFLESLLQAGIIGLITLLIVCFALIKMAWKNKSIAAGSITILLLAWFFIESVFETQYGILIFTFFPLFIFPPAKENNNR